MKKYLDALKEFRKRPYGNAVLFFGFYLIFFVALAIFFRVVDTEEVEEVKKEENKVNIEEVLNNDYTFTYEVNLDEKISVYTGKKKNNKIIFNEEDNTILFPEFFDEKNIDLLINNSYYESQTTYESGKITYNLLLSSNTINKLINKIETDIEEEANQINISKDNDDTISINLKLDSYCISNNSCLKGLLIKITYNIIRS